MRDRWPWLLLVVAGVLLVISLQPRGAHSPATDKPSAKPSAATAQPAPAPASPAASATLSRKRLPKSVLRVDGPRVAATIPLPAVPLPGAASRLRKGQRLPLRDTFKPVRDPGGRFDLQLPEGWQVDWLEPAPGEARVMSAHPKGRKDGIELSAYHSRVPGISALDLYTRTVKMASKRGETVTEGRRGESEGVVTVNLQTRLPDDGEEAATAVIVYVARPGALAQVRVTVPDRSFAEAEPVIRGILASLRLR